MTRVTKIAACVFAMALLSTGAFAYDFWGITVGTESYAGGTQLTFDGLAGTDIQYTVGGYSYTRVDSTWYGPFPAAYPGATYAVHRKVDAQGLLLQTRPGRAQVGRHRRTPQTGVAAPEVGYGPGSSGRAT